MSRVFVYALLICTLVRVPIFIHYHARTTADTLTYEKLAQRIMQLDLTGHDGARTPGYPIVLALAKNNREAVFAFQCLLGILTSALLFLLTHRTTGSNTAAMIVTLSYSLGVIWLSHEMYILTETLSVFLLILFVFLFEISTKSRKDSLYIVLGLLSAAATLTRPISIVLAITGFVFIGYIQLREHKFYKLFFFVIPMVISDSGMVLDEQNLHRLFHSYHVRRIQSHKS